MALILWHKYGYVCVSACVEDLGTAHLHKEGGHQMFGLAVTLQGNLQLIQWHSAISARESESCQNCDQEELCSATDPGAPRLRRARLRRS